MFYSSVCASQFLNVKLYFIRMSIKRKVNYKLFDFLATYFYAFIRLLGVPLRLRASVPHPPQFNTKGPLLFSPQNQCNSTQKASVKKTVLVWCCTEGRAELKGFLVLNWRILATEKVLNWESLCGSEGYSIIRIWLIFLVLSSSGISPELVRAK